MSTATYPPGTTVLIDPLALPDTDRQGTRLRVVLDPDLYVYAEGRKCSDMGAGSMVLIATPSGWEGRPIVGGDPVNLYWVNNSAVAPVDADSVDSNVDRIATALAQIEDLKREREDLKRERDTAAARLREQVQQHETYKTQVREVAIRVADEQDWCVDGLNEVLEELGLPPKTRKYEVVVRLFAYQDVTMRVEALSEDEAQEKALDDGAREAWNYAGNYDWECDDNHDPEVKEVSEA